MCEFAFWGRAPHDPAVQARDRFNRLMEGNQFSVAEEIRFIRSPIALADRRIDGKCLWLIGTDDMHLNYFRLSRLRPNAQEVRHADGIGDLFSLERKLPRLTKHLDAPHEAG